MTARIDDSGDTKSAQFPQKCAGAVDRLGHLGLRQTRIECGDGRTASDDPSCRKALAIALKFRRGRQILFGIDAEEFAALAVDEHITIEKLNVDRMAQCQSLDFRFGGSAGFRELARSPASRNDKPGPRLGV